MRLNPPHFVTQTFNYESELVLMTDLKKLPLMVVSREVNLIFVASSSYLQGKRALLGTCDVPLKELKRGIPVVR